MGNTAIGPSGTSSSNSSTPVVNAINKSLGKDDFLKLLMAELKNQDPLQPVDNKDFLAQMAQFSSLEQMNNVANSVDNMVKQSQQTLLTQGAALIGKEVTGTNTDGSTVTGLVNSVKLADNALQLMVGGVVLKMDQVTDIGSGQLVTP